MSPTTVTGWRVGVSVIVESLERLNDLQEDKQFVISLLPRKGATFGASSFCPAFTGRHGRSRRDRRFFGRGRMPSQRATGGDHRQATIADLEMIVTFERDESNHREAESALPAVVLLTGAGETLATSWEPVRRRLDPGIRVLTYRRTGVDGADRPRSLDAYLWELEGVVARERHPVVLVGHSFGGLLAQVYAERRSERVAGLVLVDATPQSIADDRAVAIGFAVSAGIASALRTLAPIGMLDLLLRMRAFPLYPEQRRFERLATAAEVRDWRAAVDRDMRGPAVEELRSVLPAARAAARLYGASALGDVPVELLTSNAYGAKWLKMHDAMAARYPRARNRCTGDRFHSIHMVHPDMVADTIEHVVHSATRSAVDGGAETTH